MTSKNVESNTFNIKKDDTQNNTSISLNCGDGSMDVEEIDIDSIKKVHRLDPDAKNNLPELLVISINTKDRIIEAVVREGTNLNLMNEKISVLCDFKSFPKKFKEIFHNYLKK